MYGFFTQAVLELWEWQRAPVTRRPPKNDYRRWLRRVVYSRDNGLCAYCGKLVAFDDFTLDHVEPLLGGGTNRKENLTVACADCNETKGTLTVEPDPLMDLQNKFASLDEIRKRERTKPGEKRQ